jgi:hypothetical protein
LLRKLIYRPKTGTLRAKWLEKLKLEIFLKIPTQFAKRNIGKCHKIIAGRFFFKRLPYINHLSLPKVVLY